MQASRSSPSACRATAAGILLLSCTAALAADYGWTSGTWAANGLPNPLLAGDTVRATGAGAKTFTGVVTNQGSILWQATVNAGLSGAGTVLRNEGLFDLQTDAGIVFVNNLGERFDNAGVLRKSAGAGISAITASFTNRSGARVEAWVGTLAYRGASTFEAGSHFAGDGQHLFDNGFATYTFQDAFSSSAGELRMVAGTFRSGGASPLIVDADLSWSGGTWQGAWTLAAGRTVTAGSGFAKSMQGTLLNQGRFAWSAAQNLELTGSGTVFVNEGRFELLSNAGIASAGNAGETFDNRGVLAKAAGDGISVVAARLINRSGGVLEAGAGSALAYRGNGSRFEAGTLFTGSGSHRFDSGSATHAFDESLINAAGLLQFVAGNFASGGSTSTQLEGGLQWSGGELRGRWTFVAGHAVEALPGSAKRVVGELVNDGALLWRTAGNLELSGAGTLLRNNGLLELRDDASIVSVGNFGETLDNAGVLRRAGVAGTSAISARLVNRSGAVLEAAALTTLAYRGQSSFEDGSVFAGLGSHRFDNGFATYTFHRQVFNAAPDLLWSAGTFASGGGEPVVYNGALRWSGGTVQGQWRLADSSAMLAQGGGFKRVVGTLVNEGAVVWQGAQGLDLYGPGTEWRNVGSFDLQSNAGILLGGNFGERFDNTGVLRKSGGTGTSTISARLSNTGVIEVTSGTLALPSSFANMGLLRGTASFASTLLDNRGRIAPGLDEGARHTAAGSDVGGPRIATLTLAGALRQSDTAILELDVGGPGVSDLLAVTGHAQFAGALWVTALPGSDVVEGDRWRVATFASRSGGFTEVIGFGFAEGTLLGAEFGAGWLDVVVLTTVVPEPGGLVLGLAGLAALAAIRRRAWPRG